METTSGKGWKGLKDSPNTSTSQIHRPRGLRQRLHERASTASSEYSGVASIYDDGVGGEWHVVDVYANFDDRRQLGDAQRVQRRSQRDRQQRLQPQRPRRRTPVVPGSRASRSTSGCLRPDEGFVCHHRLRCRRFGALNQTALDPGFGSGSGAFIPSGAGWFNLTPDNPQYASDNGQIGFSVHVGHFTFAADTTFTFDAESATTPGPGTSVNFGEGIFTTVPAPGALALLGLAGIVGRPPAS